MRWQADSQDDQAERDAGSRVLLATDQAALLDEVLRVAAAGGVEVEVASHVAALRPRWGAVPLVLIGTDLVAAVAAAGLVRRPGVVVVGRQADGSSADPSLASPTLAASQAPAALPTLFGVPGVWEGAVAVGAEEVLALPADDGVLADRLADLRDGPSRDGAVVCVVGGRGGAGASTLAAALARTAARRRRTLLVDADPLGGGVDVLLGAEDAAGLRWPDLAETQGRLAGEVLGNGLPRVGDLTVLSYDRVGATAVPPAAMVAALAAAARGFDLTVVDLPRTADEASLQALSRARLVVLVVPTQVRAAAAAERLCQVLPLPSAATGLVVRRTLGGKDYDPQAFADALQLPVWAVVGRQRNVPVAAEDRRPPRMSARSSLTQAAEILLRRLDAEQPA